MFARTERLLLRPGWAEDAPAVFQAISDERIVRNLAKAPWPYRLEHAEAFLASERRADEPSFLIFRRTAGEPRLVGAIGSAGRRTAIASSAIGSRGPSGAGLCHGSRRGVRRAGPREHAPAQASCRAFRG
jgi:RimJ/RimL family protein N-acetyltransferase